MGKKRIDKDKIIQAFLTSAAEKSAGATSLADIGVILSVNKASLYNHFSSRDEIYDAAIDFCGIYMQNVQFFPADTAVSKKDGFTDTVKKLIRQYFRSYEIEPLFQMYAFIHSEKFFNEKAASIAADEKKKIADGIISLAKKCVELKRITEQNAADLSSRASFFSDALSSQLNSYITAKKETVRQNPETGAGSLFALPTDDKLLGSIIEQDTAFWNMFN